MAYVNRHQVTVTLATSAAASAGNKSIVPDNGGYLESVVIRNPGTGITTVANILITQGGRTLWNATSTGSTNSTVVWYPRTQVSIGTTGIGYTSAATPPPVVDKFPIAALVPITVAVASGGAASGGSRSVEVDLYVGG